MLAAIQLIGGVMGLKNTDLTYGSVAKWLHWTTALCFLVAYLSFYYGHYFTEARTPDRRFITGLHTMFGITAGLLVLPRLIWKFINPQPKLDDGPKWQHMASHAAHWVLYLFIIAMPLSGWLGYGGQSVNFFWLFDIPTFRTTELFQWLVVEKMSMDFDTFESPIDFFHKVLAGRWMVWILILVHVAAALYHHFVQRDNTLRKMLPFGKVADNK